MAGCDISTVYAGIAGGHIRGLNSHGIVAVKDKEVREADLARVIEAAKAVAIPMDREILHVLPQQYIIDDQDGIRDPLGMAGVRLEAKVHIVTTSVTSAQNIVKCANRCGLQVADIVLEPWPRPRRCSRTTRRSSASPDRHRRRHHRHRPLLSTAPSSTPRCCPWAAATSPTTSPSGCARRSRPPSRSSEVRLLPAGSGRARARPWRCPRSAAASRASCRAAPGRARSSSPGSRSSSSTSASEIARSGYWDSIAAGVVLTGGTTILDGLPELAERSSTCRPPRPPRSGIGGLADVVRAPEFATGVGLVIYGRAASPAAIALAALPDLDAPAQRRCSRLLAEIF
jgi:cell division protein FtsA